MHNKVVTSSIMVKSAFYNQNEDLLKNDSEQHNKVQEMFSETKYTNVEENNTANTSSLSSGQNKQNMSNTQKEQAVLDNENKLFLDQLLGMRYKSDLNEGLDTIKNEVLLDSLDIFPQLRGGTHLNDLSNTEFKESLDYVDNFKVYEKGDHYYNGFLNTNVSSNNVNKFEEVSDKLDTKEVQLDKKMNTTAYLPAEKDNNLNNKGLNKAMTETIQESFNGKPSIENIYGTLNMGSTTNELNGYYNYFETAGYSTSENNYANNYYNGNEVDFTAGSGNGEGCDDLAGLSEFEKGLVSMCDESSTQQGSSLLASPDQVNVSEDTRENESGQQNSMNKLSSNSSKESFASCMTEKISATKEGVNSYTEHTYNKTGSVPEKQICVSAGIGSIPGVTGVTGVTVKGGAGTCSGKEDYYGSSTSFGESPDCSYESAYKMDSLAQSLLCDTSYSGEYYDSTGKYESGTSDFGNYYDSSSTPYAHQTSSAYSSPTSVFKAESTKGATNSYKDKVTVNDSFADPVSIGVNIYNDQVPGVGSVRKDPVTSVNEAYSTFFNITTSGSGNYYDQYSTRSEYYGDEKNFFRSDRNYFKDESYYADEKREDDATPFTHVASSVATVADTVTPLCSSDLSAEFSETLQVLLERYLVGDLSVEKELYSLFGNEFNLQTSEIYNNLTRYCTGKNLLYYSYKLILQSTKLVEIADASPSSGGYGVGTYADKYNTEKSVTVEVYTQTLLSLLTIQDSTHLSRSLFTHLTTYLNAQHEKGVSATTHSMHNTTTNGPCVTKEGDKVLKLYTLSIGQMTRRDPLVFDRFLGVLEDHQGRLDLRLSSLLLSYVLHADLAGKKQFDNWMSLSPQDAVCYLAKIFRITLFGRLGPSVRFALHFLDLMLNTSYSVEFVDNARTLLLFLEYVASNFPLSYSRVVLKLIEKKLFNALLFFNALQLAMLCDYGSMVTKICLSALQVLKGVVPVEFTSATFGRFEFISLENVNKLVMLISNYSSGSPASNALLSGGAKGINGLLSSMSVSERQKDLSSCLPNGALTLSAEPSGNLASNLLEVCKALFSCNKKELFVPLVECCLLVEDFQGAECIMKYYCDYYGMVSETICEKMLLSIALKGNFNYVNRLLKGTQSYESCEVFLTHSNTQNSGKNEGSSEGSLHSATSSSPSSNSSSVTNRNGLVRLSVYLVRICISMLNFNVAMNYVKPLLRLNHQNEEISNTLMMVATRLDSRSKLDSFLSFCERTSILINEPCFNVILDSCIKLKNNKRLLRIIGKFRVWGLYPNIQTFGIIIKSLSCSNMIQECEELFYNYLTYTSHVTTLSQAAEKSHAGESTSQNYTGSSHKDKSYGQHSMKEGTNNAKGLEGSFTGAANYNSGGQGHTAHSNSSMLNAQIGKERERINEIIYGCMFDAYVNNNRVDSAMRLFEDMKVRGQVKPNTIMYTTLIKGYGQNKQLDKAMKIFRMMQQDQVVPNTVTYNSIIDACARVGDMSGATSLLEDMLMNDIEPDLITFSTIIKGYCVQSDMDKSFQLLSIMYERGIMPDVILYNSLLEGCVKSGLLWLCEKLWKQMQEYDIPPSNFTLTILIKMYGRSGHLDKVFELADELPKRYNFSINTHVYTCLMSACITNGKYAMVLDIYKYMKKNGVKPDAKTFETIIQGLSRGGLFREAAQVVMEVYSLSNSNNGEAQIANINAKVLERLFQRFHSYAANPQGSSAQYKEGREGHTKEAKERGKKGSRDDILLNVANASGSSKGAALNYQTDDMDELNSLYTSLNRRLELFGIKVPKF
ncbi:pentatricopeptide repeat containing protein [Theileria orientalis]|uniref:Pentatricopeptide repeat containing protein n=1 Tax=Theileria orientalis TaxID=68886 RepID=A0A976QWY6_THEOR|nr:pentatricopeptide repeat containing protein [Theileria orientalis]